VEKKQCATVIITNGIHLQMSIQHRGDHGAGVDSGRSLRFLTAQDPESDFLM